MGRRPTSQRFILPEVELSIIVPFADHEDCIGRELSRLHDYFRRLALRFELIAVNEHSGDASVFVLSHTKKDLAHLRIVEAAPGSGWHRAFQQARGQVVLWLDLAHVPSCLALVGAHVQRLIEPRPQLDIVALPAALIARRVKVMGLVGGANGDFQAFSEELVRRARSKGKLQISQVQLRRNCRASVFRHALHKAGMLRLGRGHVKDHEVAV